MWIECLIRRPGGSYVTMTNGYTYHFKQQHEFDARHVAFVETPEHLQRFMQLSEAYAIANDFVLPTVGQEYVGTGGAQPATGVSGGVELYPDPQMPEIGSDEWFEQATVNDLKASIDGIEGIDPPNPKWRKAELMAYVKTVLELGKDEEPAQAPA